MHAGKISRRSMTIGVTAAAFSRIVPFAGNAQQHFGQSIQMNPMEAAEEISRLEVIEHIPALYTFYEHMHPDAQAIIPRQVVINWYKEDFHPLRPQPAISTGVEYKNWTWGVNGVTYPNTAEVSYIQQFENKTVQDVVRLVLHDGEWKWFFGRGREWINDQIVRFTPTLNVPQNGIVPFGLDKVEITDDLLLTLPYRLNNSPMDAVLTTVDTARTTLPDWAMNQAGMRYEAEQMYPVGYFLIQTVRNGVNITETILNEIQTRETAPPFTLHAWNVDPVNGIPYGYYESRGSDAVGNAQTIIWGAVDGDKIAFLSHVSAGAIEEIANALSNV